MGIFCLIVSIVLFVDLLRLLVLCCRHKDLDLSNHGTGPFFGLFFRPGRDNLLADLLLFLVEKCIYTAALVVFLWPYLCN